MIDVNKITSTLAKLPDAQLQQYAQMHKNDPYIMALAMSESNRRKELRSAGQGSMQEQPKVIDQMVAEMAPQQLPEEQGIGQLPVSNMDFANGGIVAFADGGDVERYQSRGLVEDVGGMGGSEIMSAAGTGMPYTGRNLLERMVFAPEEPEWKQKLRQEQAALNEALRKRNPAAPIAPVAPVVAPEAAPVERTNTERTVPVARERSILDAPSNTGGISSIEELQQKYFGPLDQKRGEIRNAQAGVIAGIKDLTQKNLEAVNADIAKEGDLYKGREERIAKQEKDIEGMGDKYLGLALLQAGAAMMSTPGGIGMALGKGVQVGSDRYMAGIDKINAAKAKFAESRDRLDDLRINRDDMNKRDKRNAEKEQRSAELKGQELLYSGLVGELNMDKDIFGKVFTAATEELKTDKTIAAQKAIASAREGKEKITDQVFNKLLQENNNDPVKAYAAYAKLTSKDESLETLLKKEQLKALADAQINAAKTGNLVPGQKEALAAMQQQILGGGKSMGAPLPANASPANLTAGTIYQTARGPAKWTGTGFAPI